MIEGATLQAGTPLGVHPQGLMFEQCYTLLHRLSSGSFGTVYTAQLLDPSVDPTIYACKVIDRTQLKPDSDKTVFRELSILRDIRDLDHITQLKDCFVTPTTVHVVQTYCKGGDVFEQLSKRTQYTERDARDLAAILLQVMQLLHLRRLCHRDLKPENLLLENRMNASHIVVADFGMAQYVPQEDGYLKTRCGTPAFVAPEVIAGRPYNCQVDMWSIGTLLYMLLGGQPPFASHSFQGLFRKIQAADYDFSHPTFHNVSIQAKQCLASLLIVDPYYRATAVRALEASWFTSSDEQLSLRQRDLSSSIRELKTWVAKRRFKSAIHAVRLSSHFSRFVANDRESLFQKVQLWDNEASEHGSSSDEDSSPSALLSQWRGKTQNFEELYELQEQIAVGRASTVFKCIRKRPISLSKKMTDLSLQQQQQQQVLAVKRVPRANVETEQAVLHEVAVMQNLSHPSMVQIKDFLEDDIYYYVVLEYIPGKTLLEHLMLMNSTNNGKSNQSQSAASSFTEQDARSIAEELLQVIAYIHAEGVVHRDVTLDNLLLVESESNNNMCSTNGDTPQDKKKKISIKLVDFGLARRVPAPRSVTRCCGTPLYMAPEVCKHIPYDQTADMWSVGVLLYMLLVGAPPFAAHTEKELFQKIRHGEWSFPPGPAVGNTISDAAQELVKKLLVVEPLQRWTAEEALRSPWFQQDASSLSSIDLTMSVSKLKDLKSKFLTVAKVVMSLTPTNSNNGSSSGQHRTEKDGIMTNKPPLSPLGLHKVDMTAFYKVKAQLFSQDPEQKEDPTSPVAPAGAPQLLDNKRLGLPTSQTDSVKHIV